jgi:hypothetical protein
MDPSFDAVCAFNESEVVFVHPRRKAGESKGRRREAVMVSIETLQPLFGFPLSEAAKAMGICDTALKSCCRRLGIPRWPSESQGRASSISPVSMPSKSPIQPSSPTTVGSQLSLEMIFNKQSESTEVAGDCRTTFNRAPSADATPVATAMNSTFEFWDVWQEPLQEQDLFQELSSTCHQEEFHQELRQEPPAASYDDVHAENLPVSDLQNLKDTPWRSDFPLAVEGREIEHGHNGSICMDAPYASSLYGHLPWEQTAVSVC